MDKNITIYHAKKSAVSAGVVVLIIVLFGLTLPLIVKGTPVETGKLIGLGSFWIMGIILTVAPLGARLEIGKDYIKTYFFGLTTSREIYQSNVQVLEYGNIFRWGGLGYGKGIKFRALVNGVSKEYNLGESVYGKEAIAHARRVLNNKDYHV